MNRRFIAICHLCLLALASCTTTGNPTHTPSPTSASQSPTTTLPSPTPTTLPTPPLEPEPTAGLPPPSFGPLVTLFGADPQRSGIFDLPAIRQMPTAKWQVKIFDSFLTTPLLAEDTLYIGTYDGQLYALDVETGQTRWASEPTGPEESIERSLAVAGDVILAGGGDGILDALDHRNGGGLWSFEADSVIYSAPLIVGEQVYFATAFTMYALELETGRLSWQSPISREDANVSSPAYDEGLLFVPTGNHLVALDATSGKEVWRVDSQAWFWGLALAHGQVYIGNVDGYFYAYDQQTGEEQWKFKAENAGDFDFWSAPAILDEQLFVGNSDRNLYALNALTGELLWKFKAEGDAISDPVIADSVIYISDSNHAVSIGPRHLYALDAQTGEALWEYGVQSTFLTGPALGSDALYISTAGDVLALK